jgi:hypothetical protein
MSVWAKSEKLPVEKLNVHVVTDYLQKEDVKKVLPGAKSFTKRDLASESVAPHPDFILGLIDYSELRAETKDWDQLEFDLLYLRAKRYDLMDFISYYKKNKSKLPMKKLRTFWRRIDEID